MLIGTPTFGRRLTEFLEEFDDDSERLSFIFGFKQFEATLAKEPHRWPLFDIRKGIASYRAVIGLYAIKGKLNQYVVFYQKIEKNNQIQPLLIWVDKYAETDEQAD